jgi:putative transposase
MHSRPSRTPLIRARAKRWAGRRLPKPSTNCSQTFISRVLRRPIESAQYTSEQFQRLMADNGVTCSMSRSGNVWDNAAMESFFSSMKTERIARNTYRSRNNARADVFDYIERFYNPTRRHSTLGYLSPMDFEQQAQVA